MSGEKVGLLDQIWSAMLKGNRTAQIEKAAKIEARPINATNKREPNAHGHKANEDTKERLVRLATPEETVAVDQGAPRQFDFIRAYVNYADVIEAPPEAHQAVATQLLSTALNPHVHIEHGAIKIPLDLWMLLLSGSGLGRNTLLDLARPVLEAAGSKGLVLNTTWGSKPAFFQNIAENPAGLFIWPEVSLVLKKLTENKFAGVKEWLTDCYDNWTVPDAIRYRETGKKSDTPPIVFQQSPRLNILATSSLDWFFSNLTQEDAAGGFVPRWVLKRLGPNRLVPKPRKPDQQLVQPLAELLRRASNLEGVADLSDVEDIYEDWYRRTHHRFSKQPNSALAMPFFNRLRTHLLKLAVVYQVSQTGSLQVSSEAMDRAIGDASGSEQTIFGLLSTGMSREGSEVEQMGERIKQAGPEGLLRSELTRAFQHVRGSDREGRIHTLLQGGTVLRFNRETPGRPAEVLVHKDCVEEHARQFGGDKQW